MRTNQDAWFCYVWVRILCDGSCTFMVPASKNRAYLDEDDAVGVFGLKPVLNVRFELIQFISSGHSYGCPIFNILASRLTFRYPWRSTVDSTRSQVIFLQNQYQFVRSSVRSEEEEEFLYFDRTNDVPGDIVLPRCKYRMPKMTAFRNGSFNLIRIVPAMSQRSQSTRLCDLVFRRSRGRGRRRTCKRRSRSRSECAYRK